MDEEHWYKACVAITDLSPCPWTLLSAGINFELFCRQVEVACRAGASGFIAGRAVWKDGLNLPENQLKSWLDTTAADRIATIM